MADEATPTVSDDATPTPDEDAPPLSENVQKVIDGNVDDADVSNLTDDELYVLASNDDRKGIQALVAKERESRAPSTAGEVVAVVDDNPDARPPEAELCDVIGEDDRNILRNLPRAWCEAEARRISHETGETLRVVKTEGPA